MPGVRPYCAAVGPKRTGVLASSGPHWGCGSWTVRVSVDGSTALTSIFADEYDVFRTLGWVRNGAADSDLSTW